MDILIVLIIVALFILPLIFFYWSSKKRGNSILFLGVSGSGKTASFMHLIYDKHFETFTSMKENIENYVINKKSYQLIDIPGEERIRLQYFDKYKAETIGMIFVIDSSKIQEEILDVADYLFSVLNDKLVYRIKPKVLIVCNKQDESKSKKKLEIKDKLKKELNNVEYTKSKQLESMDKKSKNKMKKSNKFDILNYYEAEFIETTIKSDTNTNISQLNKWLLANF